MKYRIVNPTLGEPGTEFLPGKKYPAAWIEKALRKGHIEQSANGAAKGAKTTTTKRTKGKP